MVRLDEKRKVIEVLLLAASTRNGSVYSICAGVGESLVTGDRARDLRCAALPAIDFLEGKPGYYYALSATEAAYRLIESSPTLRREWFGAR